ncbi:MAG: AAA family ATPase [Syntrophobacteraceae bacterium]
MCIITISKGSYTRGEQVARMVAARLGYRCMGREVILEASKEFDIPEIRLVRAISDAPSLLDRFTHGKEKYIAYFSATLLKQFRRDNVVYHGLAGHFFVKDVSHALKVRILADIEDRINIVMKRDKTSREEALRTLQTDDEARRNWSRSLYGIDTADPGLYDIVIDVERLTIDEAADIICHAAGLGRFQATRESQKAIDDLALAAETRAALVGIRPDAEVRTDDGFVSVHIKLPLIPFGEERHLVEEMKRVAESVRGVRQVDIKVSHTWVVGPQFS